MADAAGVRAGTIGGRFAGGRQGLCPPVPEVRSRCYLPRLSGVLSSRVSPCSRLAVLTVSPITVNDRLCSLPTSPSTAGP